MEQYMQRNRQSFQDIVKGRYGRKTAYVNVDKITEDNILLVLSKCTGIFNSNRVAIRYLWNYKNGDQPILYRQKLVRDDIVNRVVENHAYEIVQFNVAQTYGEPIQYVSTSDNETINNAVDDFNNYMKRAYKFQRNIKQGEWKSAVGTSYLAIQKTGTKEKPFRITVPTPMNTFVIYSSYTEEPLLAVQELKDDKDERYFLCFSDTHEFTVKDSKLVPYSDGVKSRVHAFGGIPIVEVPNNQDRLSDVEIVITLLDAINNMQSNRMDGIEQFVQSWIKFVNCEVDEDQFKAMKMQGALVVKSNNGTDNKADVDVMTTELNQTESQVAKEDLLDNVWSVLAIPTKQSNTGGDTQGAVELRNGWDFSKNRAKLKDAYVMEAESRLAAVALNILRVYGKSLNITVDDFEVNIPHSPQDNMSVKANVLTLLLNAGIAPLIAIKTSGLWNDAEKVYLLSKPYLDKLNNALDEEISKIPDAKEQTEKAQKIIEQNTNGQSIPSSSDKLKERIANALNA